MSKYQTEEQRVAEICSRVKGPSPDQQWNQTPPDRLSPELREKLNAAQVKARSESRALKRRYVELETLADDLNNLDAYAPPEQIERALEVLERPAKTIFEERNFIGRSREHSRKAVQKAGFIASEKIKLENLKRTRPDEYDLIAPVARAIRTVSDELARLEMSFNDIGPEFDEFSKDLKEDIARRRAEALAKFDAEELALDEYGKRFKAERKTLAVEVRKAAEGAK